MTPLRSPSSRCGFTLVEILIVVTVIGILSWLSLLAIGRIKEAAAESIIRNNLRIVYDAKELYFSEVSAQPLMATPGLVRSGHLSERVATHLTSTHTLEAGRGWRYFVLFRPGAPAFAYKGSVNPTTWEVTGEAIYYPTYEKVSAPRPGH